MINPSIYRNLSILLIIFFTTIHLIDSYLIDLGDAEALYWNYSQHLSGGYMDHPPLIGWIIKIVTYFFGNEPFWVRLPSNISFIISAIICYNLSKQIHDSNQAGFYSLLILCGIPLTGSASIAAGPEAISIALWFIGLWIGYKVFNTYKNSSIKSRLNLIDKIFWPFVTGLILGFTFLAKYTGSLLILSFFVLSVQKEYRWIYKTVIPYITGLTILIVISPVIYWNIQHDFASILHRFSWTQHDSGFSFRNAGALIGGQLLYFSPILVIILLWSLKKSINNFFFLYTSFIPLVVLYILMLWSRVAEPHWSLPGYCSLMIVTSGYIINGSDKLKKWFKNGLILGFLFSVLLHLLTLTPLLIILTPKNSYKPEFDLSNELRGWQTLIKQIKTRYDDQYSLASAYYTICSQLSYNATRQNLKTKVYCISPQKDDFDIWKYGKKELPDNFIFITDNRFNHKIEKILPRVKILNREQITIYRQGILIRKFSFYLCKLDFK